MVQSLTSKFNPGTTLLIDMTNYRLPNTIESEQDVYDFFAYVIGKEKTCFHPDDSFHGYIDFETREKAFTDEVADSYDRLRLQCFEVCNKMSLDRIYEIGMEVDRTLRAASLISSDIDTWSDDAIQFPRLIAELEAVGALRGDVVDALCESMDLAPDNIAELIERAQLEWDKIKSETGN